MNRIRVVVLTTTGPSVIERITAEDPAVSSVVCLSGKALALSISRAYDAFVRDPTGVVQCHFGHSAFRIDVSAPIAEGFSWQLGVLLAHGLAAAGRLAGPNDPADRAVYVSGEVDRDLNILAVDHLPEKLSGIDRDGPDATSTVIYVPEASRHTVPDSWRNDTDTRRVLGVSHVNDLFRDVGLDPLAAGSTTPRSWQPLWNLSRGWARVGSAFIVVALLAMAALVASLNDLIRIAEAAPVAELESALDRQARGDWADRVRVALFRRYLAWARPGPTALKIELVERRAPAGSTCAAIAAGQQAPVLRTRTAGVSARFRPMSAEGLCGMQVSVQAAGLQLWGLSEQWSGGRDGSPETVNAFGPGAGGLEIGIEPPRRAAFPLRFRTTIFAASRSLDDLPGWWRDQLAAAGARPGSRAQAEAIARLERLGILVRDVIHEIDR